MHTPISLLASCNVRLRAAGSLSLGLAACLIAGPSAHAQISVETSLVSAPGASSSVVELPEAPSVSTGTYFQTKNAANAPSVAGKYDMVIQPGQVAPKLSARDKFLAGTKDSFSPVAVIGWVLSAGYSTAVDGSPNYGQNGKGFAQSLGASAARATSENFFTEAILAPVLHEDARYYRMGRQRNFFTRVGYSITRPILTRTDGGHQTLNIANLGGNLAGSALTQAYYPPLNTGFNQVMQTFGGSVGGSALGFFVLEFLPDLIHHKR